MPPKKEVPAALPSDKVERQRAIIKMLERGDLSVLPSEKDLSKKKQDKHKKSVLAVLPPSDKETESLLKRFSFYKINDKILQYMDNVILSKDGVLKGEESKYIFNFKHYVIKENGEFIE